MRDRLIELIDDSGVLAKCGCHYNDVNRFCKQLADYLLENGVIVPPVKVGDTVYYLNKTYTLGLHINKIYEANVVRIINTSIGIGFVIRITSDYGRCEIVNCDWNKTLFSTKEKAEKALKGGAE